MSRSRALLRALVLGTLLGCGGAQPSAPEAVAGGSADESPAGSASGGAVRHPSCPARYDAPGPACDGSPTSVVCEYPEGTCSCGWPRACSGAAPRPGPPPPPTWVCHERERECPPVGSPCRAGDVCAPWCCGVGAVCLNGYWAAQDFPCPP